MQPNEPTQPTNQNQQPPQAPQPDLALRSYFLQQGQSIIKIYSILQSNIVAYGFKAFLSVVLQIFCYLLFAFAIYVALSIPSDLPGLAAELSGKKMLAYIPYENEDITNFLLGIRILIAVISLPVLICAFLLGKNRRKSARIRKAFNEAELMKTNFDQATQYFRF